MLLSDIITAYQNAATTLDYVFVFGEKKDVIDVGSNDKRTPYIWLDRAVTGGMNSKLIMTKSGVVTYSLNLHSIQPYYQELEAQRIDQTIYDNHTTRLINFLGEAHLSNTSLAKGVEENNPINFEKAVFMGQYIGVMISLTYRLDYCNG